MAFVLTAGTAFAAGGACPSGANYTNPANPPGASVTLASLGITNCYYVAASGSDSNNGTSEATPWAHAPQMPNCSGACATAQNQSNGIPPGTGIILRGGDTWHFGNSGASPYTGGTWNFNSGQYPMGTQANPIYVGVDPGWSSGASWVRPILTGDNAINASTTLSSCSYQIGSANDFFDLGGLQYYIVDNFEMLGLCQSSTGQPGHHDVYFSYGGLRGPVVFMNDYLHGWSHVQFAGSNGGPACTGSAVCINIFMFNGSVSSAPPGETVVKVVVDGSDSDPAGAGLCFGGFYNVSYSAFLYTSQCVTGSLHLFHDNLYGNFYENGHSNVLESGNNSDIAGTNAIYNNVFFNLETTGSAGGVGLWPSPPVGSADYIFNNLMYAVGQMEVFNVGLNGGDQGSIVAFNNTFQINSSSGDGAIFGCQSAHAHPFTAANNHYIIDTTPYTSPCNGLTATTNLLMSNSTAASDGYTSSESYVFSPTSLSSPTAGTGTNNASFCSAISTAVANDPTLSNAAATCQNDTPYACTYISSNHTLSCPARTVSARPLTTAWDEGAYQSGATTSSAPNPPQNLTAVVN